MALRPHWQNIDQVEEFRTDATAMIRWEAAQAIISTYSNFDINAYGQSSDYQQEIMPIPDFLEQKQAWVKERFGPEAWQQMLDLAGTLNQRSAALEDYFRSLPEDPTIHRLRPDDFQHIRNRPSSPEPNNPGNWFGESIFSEGRWYLTPNESSFQVQDENDNLIYRPNLPDEIWVRDIWLAGHQIYVPCRSYCWPTLFLHYQPGTGVVARSALGYPMDPLPSGFWRDLKVPT